MSQKPTFANMFMAEACVLFLFLSSFVQGAQVWVSATIPPSIYATDAFDITADDSGKLWTTFTQNADLRLATTSGNGWTSELIFPLTFKFDIDSDRRILVDKLGVSHIFFVDNLRRVIHTYKPNTVWQLEVIASVFFDSDHETTVAIDATNVLHVAYPRTSNDQFQIFYTTRSGAYTWTSEIAGTSPYAENLRSPHVSLDTTSDGIPFLSYSGVVGDPVKVLTKRPGGWTDIQSFSGNWWWPTLRVDGTNHIHLVMTSTATNAPITRYLVMDSSGTVQLDSSFTLSELVATNPPRPSLAIDRQNRAHIAVGSAYIAPPANPVYLPSNYSVDSVTKIALTKNNEPYFLGLSPVAPFLLLTARVDSPGSAQVVERTTHSLTWNFTPATGSVLEHRLIRVSDGVDVSGPLGPTASSFTQTGLSPNESQTLVARAIFPGLFADSVASTGHTLGVTPTDIKLNRSSGNTLAVSWAPAGNATGTLYRLHLFPTTGTGIVQETTNQAAQFQLLDPAIPYAVSLAAVGGDGVETFVSTLSKTAQDGTGATFSFENPGGLGVDISIQGAGSGPALAVTEAPADSFPTAPFSFGAFTPAGVGFDVPTSQAVPLGQTVILTLRYPEGRLNSTDALTLARFDSDRNQWVPLATQVDGANRRLTASTRALGLFQVMVRTSPPTDVGSARVYPNPFRPTVHSVMAIQEVPAGTQVRIYSDGGRLVREFTTSEGNATWDGRDGDGNPVHSGAYVLRLEQNGGMKRVRFVLER